MKFLKFYSTLLISLLTGNALAEVKENNWGIAAGFRSAMIPFASDENSVEDFIPLMFYEGETFFIRGLTAGAQLYEKDQFQINALGRYRFFDIPKEYQNLVREDAIDLGLELKYQLDENWHSSLELMSDTDGRLYSSLNTGLKLESGAWDILPYAKLRFKTDDFNDHYFGLDGFSDPVNSNNIFSNKIGSGLDLTIGSEVRYHVTSNFYLLGRAQLTALDKDTADSVTIDDDIYGEAFIGIAFFNDKTKKKSHLDMKPYIRLAHAWATPSDLGQIIRFNSEDDDQDNQLTSIFYGHPIADSLFGVDKLDIYMTLGYAYHHDSNTYSQTLAPGKGINKTELSGAKGNPCSGNVPCTITYDRQPAHEFLLGIKAYYNLDWPFQWRLGFAEGISYIDTVSNIEQREMDKNTYRSSNLMNYLDLTVDFSIGKAFDAPDLKDWYLGVGVHHRSSIFESSSAFGRIKGGSNYNSIYLQHHF
jgi:outer membrane protein